MIKYVHTFKQLQKIINKIFLHLTTIRSVIVTMTTTVTKRSIKFYQLVFMNTRTKLVFFDIYEKNHYHMELTE